MTGGAQVLGQDALAASLRTAAQQLRELDAADDKAGGLLADVVRSTAPRLSGYMASTVSSSGAVVTVGAPYGVYVNARTGWAVKALQDQTSKVLDTYEAAIADVIAQVKGA